MTSKADPVRMLEELHSMEALLAESDQLRRVLENPSIPGEQKRAVLDAVIQRTAVRARYGILLPS